MLNIRTLLSAANVWDRLDMTLPSQLHFKIHSAREA